MDVRIVAYRPATSSATLDTGYELELNEQPNISLNYQFSDIKEPETRKGNYSQTFKLPFTRGNNEFFENWYDVNLTTLVFSTTKKFTATVFVNGTPQFEGVLQLKGVYQKAEQYEVVVLANTANLFTEIGDKKLVDAIGEEFDHTFTYANIKLSWDGTSGSFNNAAGTSLRDSVAGVQKVVYPLTASEIDKFYFGYGAVGEGTHLNMNQATFNALSGYAQAEANMTNIEQFKPALQLKAILKLIIANAGFSYTSEFIDGTGAYSSDPYFGKLFMTTCNLLTGITPAVETTPIGIDAGTLLAKSNSMGLAWNTYIGGAGVVVIGGGEWFNMSGFVAETDPQGSLVDSSTIQIVSPSQNQIALYGWQIRVRYVQTSSLSAARLRLVPLVGGVEQTESSGILTSNDIPLDWYTGGSSYQYSQAFNYAAGVFDVSNVPVGTKFRPHICFVDDVLSLGSSTPVVEFIYSSGADAVLQSNWLPYSASVLSKTVDMSACVDPNITQRAFLKDILERFNMVIISDPNDPNNVIIEPYVDYLKDGEIKNWTTKLDESKEVVVKDTSSLQKRVINFTDLEDVDLLNKITAEYTPEYNVWGKFYQENTNNEFATGELTNNPIFAPFRVDSVYQNASGQLNPAGPDNLTVHYVFSTENTPDGIVDVLKETKPKLFYYRGTPTSTAKAGTNELVSIYMHSIDTSTDPFTRTAYEFTQYPVCTVWDIDTSGSTYQYTLTSANRSLFWGVAPPDSPGNTIFNYTAENVVTQVNNMQTLYGRYWNSYLNATYSKDARMMECNIMLDEVDIYNFKFSDEIFIKDTYWRILNISNYQVGSSVATKVTLLKAIDGISQGIGVVDLGAECNYVLADPPLLMGYWYSWCPDTDPGCTPTTGMSGYEFTVSEAACCEHLPNAAIDYMQPYEEVWSSYPSLDGLVGCVYVEGSSGNAQNMPVINNNNTALSILNNNSLKSYFKAKSIKNFTKGSANTKFNRLMIPQTEDDLGIKYVSKFNSMPQVTGESHKLILLGTTTNIQTAQSYIQGDDKKMSIPIIASSNMMIEVMGMSTIVSSSNGTYGVGHTEQFVYYTAFRNSAGTVTQIGTALGRSLVSNIESGSQNSYLEITSATDSVTGGKVLNINVKSTADNTIKVFTLDVNITLQRIDSFYFDTNWALWQNGQRIQLQNADFLIWN